MLCDALGDRAVGAREPGGTELGERVRSLLGDRAVEMGAHAEALLFAAARAELVEQVIKPALAEGRVVVCDRFLDSSLAYQGVARGLGVEEVARVNEWAIGGELRPDLTFLLVLDPGEAASRAGDDARFGSAEVQALVQQAYERMADAEPERWRRVDARRSAEEVHADVLASLNAVAAA
jgi:dTMP kinase